MRTTDMTHDAGAALRVETRQHDTTPVVSARPKFSWRVAASQVVIPALRLHRYRNTRTRMLYDALNDVDCRQ